MGILTVDQFRDALPAQIKKTVGQEVIDGVNKTLTLCPELRESYRDNLIGYSHVLMDGKFKMSSYVEAVRYVSYKVMGNTNKQAYIKAFPDRYQKHLDNGITPKNIDKMIHSYNKNRLVNIIFEQTLIPTHILNADLFQSAINTQYELMTDTEVSPKVRSDAANSLLTHLKAPEAKKVELEITHKEDSMVTHLKELTIKLAEESKAAIEDGRFSAQQIAHQKVVQAEVIEHVG